MMSGVFVVATFVGVSVSEEVQKERRHASIEKDIVREKWRAAQLGLETRDDGFADKYLKELKESQPVTATRIIAQKTEVKED